MTEPAAPDEIQERVDMALTFLVRGFAQRDIVDYMHTKTDWGQKLTKRALRNYVYSAREELARMAAGDINRREQFTLAVNRLNEQYRKANQLNDAARAIQAVNAMVNLLALDQPQAADRDWRAEAEAAGLDSAALFEQLVQVAANARS